MREVNTRELFPNRGNNSYNSVTSTLPILNLAYYPDERGPYNFDPNLNYNGTLPNPQRRWGGMMRKLDTSDFETANIEYIEFWLLDPFIYSNEQPDANQYGGDLYINLGEVSEDILRDGRKFYESGMPVDGSQSFTTTQWGKIPTQATVTYAFATTDGSRELQDVGYNGLTDAEEREFGPYQEFLSAIQGRVSPAQLDSIMNDPANDDYHYFRGSDFDRIEAPILYRYKRINNPQGNSPDSNDRTESYDTSYKTTPDVEDINQDYTLNEYENYYQYQDYTLNEYENYYQYRISMRPEDFVVGRNFIVDKRETSPRLRNGKPGHATWYQFRIPLDDFETRVGSINDFSSIRFMRMFLTDFQKPVVLRFATLDLVRGEWRTYEQPLDNTSHESGSMSVSAVNIEENNDKSPVNYILPPGITREQDPTQPQLAEENEQALSFTVNNFSTNEAKAVYKNTTLDLRQYKRIEMFVHANAFEQNTTNLADNQLAVFIRLGSDYRSNYYEYEIPLKLTAPGVYGRFSLEDARAVWPEENMLDIPLSVFTDLKKARNTAKSQGLASFSVPYTAYDEDKPNNKISIVGNPTLGEVKTMMIGVRNLSGETKSGEVWVNELRLKEYNNTGGWAAQGALNVQLSDIGSLNATGKIVTDGFGGIEDGVAERSQDDYKTYSFTANIELGRFFPDKAKVSAPLYYSITKEETRPKYNPLDTDMLLDESLDAIGDKHERDSVERIAVTKTTNTNFSLSNVRVGIQTKRHPMPYDPANFSFSYSHSHSYTSGETTVYEKEDNWRGALNYSYTPVYKPFEPFKKLIKSRSKWYDILKRFGLNWLPQNIAFDTEMTRNYYELQERDMESAEGNMLPLTFSEQFLWNRSFSVRWDLTKNLHMNFTSATNAEIETPYTPVNKDLYPDRYSAWKDSVWTSIKDFGRPLDYNQTFTASYQLPLNLVPIFDWINADGNYNATYNWTRGTELEDGTSLGNSVTMNRQYNINGTFNLERLYNHVPFLKKTNDRFNKTARSQRLSSSRRRSQRNARTARKGGKDDKDGDKEKKVLPKNKRSFEKEIVLMPDTQLVVSHGKKSRRLMVSAKTKDGKTFRLKYKKLDNNRIRIVNKVDTATTLKLTVTPKAPLEDSKWYKAAQCVARGLMLVRNVSFSYRNQYSMYLPGFMPEVGDMFGQRGGDVMAPGVGFAFGFAGDSYIDKAAERGWLLMADSVATPATTSLTEDFQLRMTLEPVKNLKIDLNASRTETKSKSIQYMYQGSPTTQSGTLTMTTISLGSAFEGMGDAKNGYRSKTFEKFCRSLDGFRDRVEAQYAGATYPAGTALAGKPFDPANGTVSKYSADVMVPAFLSAYTSMGGKSLSIFPTLTRLLPNWTLRYSGLVQLPWFRDVFKSFNINHSYNATTGNPVPGSMFNVSTVSINEAFSPLLGIDMTFHNNLTCKLEYRKTRVLSLSMTSIQVNEAVSNDWVVGMSYKINNFKLFGGRRRHRVRSSNAGRQNNNSSSTSSTSRSSGFNTDLNLRLDLSYRKQASICRDIATMTSSASSGNTAFKLSFSADYTLSRLLTMSFYYDRQTNTPLLSSSSYPTTTQDFGLSLKFSLTR